MGQEGNVIRSEKSMRSEKKTSSFVLDQCARHKKDTELWNCFRFEGRLVSSNYRRSQSGTPVICLSSQLILPYSYFRYWTATSLQMMLMRGAFSSANDMNRFLMIFSRISFHCKLILVQYWEYEFGLLWSKTIFLAKNAAQHFSRLASVSPDGFP